MRMREIMEAPSLVAALKIDGRMYRGHPGQSHDEVLENLPQHLWDRDVVYGFANHKGQFLNRTHAMTYARQHDLLNHNHPYRQDLEADELHADLLREEDLSGLMARIKQRNDDAQAMLTTTLAKSRKLALKHPDGRRILISPSLDSNYQWRLTHVDPDGQPSGHTEYSTVTRQMAVDVAQAMQNGFTR